MKTAFLEFDLSSTECFLKENLISPNWNGINMFNSDTQHSTWFVTNSILIYLCVLKKRTDDETKLNCAFIDSGLPWQIDPFEWKYENKSKNYWILNAWNVHLKYRTESVFEDYYMPLNTALRRIRKHDVGQNFKENN